MLHKHFINPNEITIRAARVNAGLNPEDVSRELGIRPCRLERIERNSGRITHDTAKKLARLYGRKLDEIYWGRESDYHHLLHEQRAATKMRIVPMRGVGVNAAQ